MPPAPAHPATPSDPASTAGDLAALRAECQRLRELSARQTQEFAALHASLEKKVEERTAESLASSRCMRR